MKAVVAAFNQEKALVGAFSELTNLRMELFQALMQTLDITRPSVQASKAVSVAVVLVLGAGRGRGVFTVWGPASNYQQRRQYPEKISADHRDSDRDYSFTQPFERWASPTDAIDIRYASP